MLFCSIRIIKPVERLKDYDPNKAMEKIHSGDLYFPSDNSINR
jgi:hypothetical protein